MSLGNKCFAAAAVAVGIAAAPWAPKAGAEPYVAGSLGGQDYVTDGFGGAGYDIGPFGSVAIGYRTPGKLLRFEFETSLQAADHANAPGHLTAFTYMPNLFLDIPTNTKWVPYVGGGIGGAKFATGSAGFNHDPSFAWQLEGGLNYDLTERFTVGVGYRYQQFVMPVSDLDSSIVKLNVRYGF